MQSFPAEWIQNYPKFDSYHLLMKTPSAFQTLDEHFTFIIVRYRGTHALWNHTKQLSFDTTDTGPQNVSVKANSTLETSENTPTKYLDTTEIHKSTLIKLYAKFPLTSVEFPATLYGIHVNLFIFLIKPNKMASFITAFSRNVFPVSYLTIMRIIIIIKHSDFKFDKNCYIMLNSQV